jgi:hypothetical protein
MQTIEEQIQAIWPKTDLRRCNDYYDFYLQTEHFYSHGYDYLSEQDCEFLQRYRTTVALIREHLSEALVSPYPAVREMANLQIRLDKLFERK